MKRFLKILALLVVALFALVSGMDATLDRLSHAATQNAFTCYSPKGRVIFAYNGDLALCPTYLKPPTVAPLNMLRSASFTPAAVD